MNGWHAIDFRTAQVLLLVGFLVLLIGVSLGASGYGGFLVPTLLVVCLGMDPRTAVAHGLLSFVLPGAIGAWLYRRKRQPASWRVALWLCAGTLPGTGIGRLITQTAPDLLLQAMIAALVGAAGGSLLVRRRTSADKPSGNQSESIRPIADLSRRRVALASLGAGFVAGVASVTAGVGGPLITVPILLRLGMDLAPVVGSSLMSAVFNSALGMGALSDLVQMDWPVLSVISLTQLGGMPVGVWLHDRIGTRMVTIISAMALLSSAWLIVQAVT